MDKELELIQEQVTLKLLGEVCPEEEVFFKLYIKSTKEKNFKYLNESCESFSGENFPLSGDYQLIGSVVSIIAYELVKYIYKKMTELNHDILIKLLLKKASIILIKRRGELAINVEIRNNIIEEIINDMEDINKRDT